MKSRRIIEQFKQGQFQSIVIYGPTASGKSALALELADALGEAIIINADSMQVYKEIPILTSQPKDLTQHSLYGFLSCVDDSFSVAKWLALTSQEINNSTKTCIVVGGTGLYISCLLKGLAPMPDVPQSIVDQLKEQLQLLGFDALYKKLQSVDPATAGKISDPQRTIRALAVLESTGRPISELQKLNHQSVKNDAMMKIFVRPERGSLYEGINARFIEMLASGAIEEVQALLTNFPTANYPKAIGLREIIMYLKNELAKADMIDTVQRLTRNYAKRQETWFRNQLICDVSLE